MFLKITIYYQILPITNRCLSSQLYINVPSNLNGVEKNKAKKEKKIGERNIKTKS